MDSSTIKDGEGFSHSNSSFITVASNKASNGIEKVVVHSSKHSDANSSITSVSLENKVNSNIKPVQNSVTKEVLDDSKDSLPATSSNEANFLLHILKNVICNGKEEVLVHSSNHSDANSSISSASSENKVNSNIKAAQNTVAKEVVNASKKSLPAKLSNKTNAQNTSSIPDSLDLGDAFRDNFASNNLHRSAPVPSDNKFQKQDKETEFDNRQKQISSTTSANFRMPNSQLLDANTENKEEFKYVNVPTPKDLEYGNYLLRVISNKGQKEYIYRPLQCQTFDIETSLKSSSMPNGNSTNHQQQPYGSGSSKTNKQIGKQVNNKFRHTFTEEEKRLLEAFYAKGKYLTYNTAQKIGAALNMNYIRIQGWYHNRRIKDRKKI